MSALVNYGGDDFCSGTSCYTNSTDLGRLRSISSQVDVYCPPRKRYRISASFSFGESEFGQNKQQSINALPDECLLEIFNRLPSGQERSSCACVSKHWLTLLTSIHKGEYGSSKVVKENVGSVSDDVEMISFDEDDGYLRRCLEGKKATDLRLAALAVGTSGRGGLGKLFIKRSNSSCGVTNFGLIAVARGCPSLKSLSLWNVHRVGCEGLSEIAKECHLLEKLDLCQCPSVSDKAKLCPKLRSVSIKDCPLVGDHGISSLLSSASAVLSKVKLQGLNITDFSLAVIGHYGKSVTNLMLSGLNNVSEKGFWVMGNALGLQKLVSLTITSCRGVTDVSLDAMGKGCIKLKQMCLRKFGGVQQDYTIRDFGVLSSCGLKSLTLVKCMGIKNISLEAPLPTPCNSLKSLSVRNCLGFGTGSLAMVGKLCPRLQHLDLTGLYGITNAGLLPFHESCEAGLVKVNLSGCLNLTDEVVLALTRLHGETLELLNLNGCRKITDTSLVAIADNCIFLSDLDLSRCAITDSGVAGFLKMRKPVVAIELPFTEVISQPRFPGEFCPRALV
ncbi:hypothetical protein F3Y22_tig00110321pilonHSYRG00114 [Hibiscus syriacus]|uniref:F-box domain-containing protein n=1 Tax=Hibiscus syriacus TaxID=106335 RepID=A0A6A3B551_HIBSY|nr:hypothetical protein F3Y22_tig00110321pilonHSYRG00114 [Hibiscus syriacus]